MRPVQLVPVDDATAGHVARDVPTYEPVACNGCAFIPVCKDRGAATVFLVEGVKGTPVYCQKIDGRMVACKTKHLPDLEPKAPQKAVEAPMYVCDSNVFINAQRWNWTQCQLVLERAGSHYRLATTRAALSELKYAYKLPADLTIIDVDMDSLDPMLVDLAQANASDWNPQDHASKVDLSIVQAVLDDPGLAGVLSEDDDLRRLHVPSLVRDLVGRETAFMTCAEFCRSRRPVFPDYEG